MSQHEPAVEESPESLSVGEGEAAKPAGYKFGDDAPEYLRGKSPAEAIGLMERIAGQNQLLAAQLETLASRPLPVAAAPAAAPKDDPSVDFEPADFLEAGAGVKEKLEQLVDIKTRPYADRMAYLQQSLMRSQAEKTFPHLAVYSKEVDQLLSQLQPGIAAMPATWHTISNHILLSHFDDIAKVRSDARAKPAAPANSGKPGATAEAVASTGTLTSEEKHAARMMGVPEAEYLKHKTEAGL